VRGNHQGFPARSIKQFFKLSKFEKRYEPVEKDFFDRLNAHPTDSWMGVFVSNQYLPKVQLGQWQLWHIWHRPPSAS